MNGITKETFKECDTDSKLDILFDYIKDMHHSQTEHPKACDDRFKLLENRKLKDTATSSLFGFVGGFIAVMGKKFLGMG